MEVVERFVDAWLRGSLDEVVAPLDADGTTPRGVDVYTVRTG